MTRAVLAALLAAVAVPAAAADPLPVAPPPREVRPDGSRDPAPAADKAEDPEAVVGRIMPTRSRRAISSPRRRGEGTRSTQATILKDIDKLLTPPDSPPQGGGGDGSDKNDKKDKNNQDKDSGTGQSKDDKSDQSPKDGQGGGQKGDKGGMPDMQPGNSGGMGQPKGGMGQPTGGQATTGRRPRMGSQPKDGKEPGGSASAGKGKEQGPMPPPNATAKAGNPKDPPGATAAGVDGKRDVPPPPLSPQVPLADEVAKEVWGHLPERLRQQMSQYYREEFMPRYAGLLKQYYSSLANSPTGPTLTRPAPPR